MDAEFLIHNFEDGHDGVVVKNKLKPGVRHVQILYMWVCGMVFGAIRGSNSIAVLALTDKERLNDTYIQVYSWDRKIQGALLSSFYFGHALMLLPAEVYLTRVSGKYVLTVALAISGALSVAMPTIVNKGGWLTMCNAFLWMGMTQACLSPCNQALLAKWLPPGERKMFSWVVNSGTLIGTIVSIPVSDLLSKSRLGWELVFYSQAMLTLSMLAIWGLLTGSEPERHPVVGDAEMEIIKEAMKHYNKRKLQVPWSNILRSRSFWALACAHAASNAVFVFCLTDIPVILKIIGISIKDNSWLFVLMFLALWSFRMSTASTVDWTFKILNVSFNINISLLRKLINTLGASGVLVGLIILPSLAESWPRLTPFMLVGVMAALGFQYSGFMDNHKDLSENYAGTLLMMTSVIASVIGAWVPALSGLIVGDEVTIKRYNTVIISLASLYLGCNLAYTILASSDRQTWDVTTAHNMFGYHNVTIDKTQVELEELNTSKMIQQRTGLDDY